jgi:hypothetical protein
MGLKVCIESLRLIREGNNTRTTSSPSIDMPQPPRFVNGGDRNAAHGKDDDGNEARHLSLHVPLIPNTRSRYYITVQVSWTPFPRRLADARFKYILPLRL